MTDLLESEETRLMVHHGIRREQVAQYLYKHYRYSRLSDAVAQAARDEKRDPGKR